MENRKNSKEWLIIFIILITMFTIAGTYAFFNIKEYYEGTFEVEIRSKGIDTFTLEKTEDVDLDLNEYNFSKGIGHNIVGETDINPVLETSNEKAKICYKLEMRLPDEQVFNYTNGNNPEVMLDVLFSKDGENYTKLIDSMDITATTGSVPVPVTMGSDNYKHSIETTRHKKTKYYYKARVTFVYYESVDQSINNNKEFASSLNANVVEC